MGDLTREIEARIHQAISLGAATDSGFHSYLCPICEDTKHGRAGFRFDDEAIIYNCFRASCTASCSYKEGQYVNRRFRQLMDAIGVELPIEVLAANRNARRHEQEKLQAELYQPFAIHDDLRPVIEEEGLKRLTDYHAIRAYRSSNRTLLRYCPASVARSIYVTTNECHGSNRSIPQGIVAFCCWYGECLAGIVYYNHLHPERQTARSDYLIDSRSAPGMIYMPMGYLPDNPIVVEGIFDALVFPHHAVALLGNHVTKTQAWYLRNSNPILLPDRTGSKFFESAKTYNWSMSIPDWKFKDLDEAAEAVGELVAARVVHNSIIDEPKLAEIAFKMYHEL